MIITATDLNEIESVITDNYLADNVYTFTTTNGNNLNCSFNQILSQINNGKLVQIKFNNISASNANIQYWDSNNETLEYCEVTGVGIAYDFVLGLHHDTDNQCYAVYLPKYGYYMSSTNTGILTAFTN